MQKYKKLLPVIIYPYIDALVITLFLLVVRFINDDPDGIGSLVLILFAVVYFLFTLICTIMHTVAVAKNKVDYYDAAKMNLVVRCAQIPAYVFHFIMGCVGLMLSVFGLGFFLWAILIDLMTISITGIIAIGCCIRMCKDRVMSVGTAVTCTIFSFVFVVDVVMAFLFFSSSKKLKKQNTVVIMK